MGSIGFDFADQTVLVTGASSGIGRQIAREFATAGATVINADRQEAPRDENEETPTHELVRNEGGTARFVTTDVSDVGGIEAAVDVAADYGGLDVMVNNAGVHVSGTVLELTEAQFDRMHEVNVKGCFFGCQAAARHMLEHDRTGCIINMASISSTMAKPGQIGYESTKGAIRMITRSAALDLGPQIRVNAIAPGRTATDFGSSSAVEKRRSVQEGDMLKPVPMGRVGTPEDVAGAALFLASDRAEYVTGELLFVDGGYQVS